MTLELSGLRCTVLGLGVHGGGLAAAQFLHARGARVTVTDLRSEKELATSLAGLPSGVRTVIGRHEDEDARSADLLVKNPAVPRSVPMVAQAPFVTTDIALFLAEWMGHEQVPPGPLVAITGTKGKSSTSAAAAHLLAAGFPGTRLGGNITVSPLGFAQELDPGDPVVLELSSFQLGDLAFCRARPQQREKPAALSVLPDRILKPTVPARVAAITSIFRDHQDYYDSMESYVEDKREIYRHLAPEGIAVFHAADTWGASFVTEAVSRYGEERVVDIALRSDPLADLDLRVPGTHSRRNLHMAAVAARHLGLDETRLRAAAADFGGVAHRLELVLDEGGIRAVNDSAATIPEAALAAVQALEAPVILIAGGSDKGLDPGPLVSAVGAVEAGGGTAILLAGSATPALAAGCARAGYSPAGPYRSLEEAVRHALRLAGELGSPLRPATVLLSPGCASFGMFRNEFDRGDQFRRLLRTR